MHVNVHYDVFVTSVCTVTILHDELITSLICILLDHLTFVVRRYITNISAIKAVLKVVHYPVGLNACLENRLCLISSPSLL